MKIEIKYYAHIDDPVPSAYYNAFSLESAEENFGKLTRFIENNDH